MSDLGVPLLVDLSDPRPSPGPTIMSTMKRPAPLMKAILLSVVAGLTTSALMRLVEEGRISLDDDVSELARFPVRNPLYPETPITVRMVLSHSSSLNDSQGYFNLDVLNPATNPDYGKCYNDYEPGTRYQ